MQGSETLTLVAWPGKGRLEGGVRAHGELSWGAAQEARARSLGRSLSGRDALVHRDQNPPFLSGKRTHGKGRTGSGRASTLLGAVIKNK